MARTGRFGKLPARAPDLTSTIVALIEAAAAQDDRNILSSWSEGGEFRGKKVTDQMVRDWFAKRRSQYSTDDPEYDYWDQQLDQIDYDIGESKMLLRTAGGSKADYAHASQWYKTNAKRFPRNSEAWREAMRNAAGYQKAAQESAHTTRTISDYEKFNTRVTALQKSKVDPAMRAVGIVDDALHRMGLSDFMSLDATQKANASVQIQDFIRNDDDGRRFARQWKRLTGHDFTYNSLRRVIREGKRGSAMQADVARKYGYSPTQFVQGAQNFETYDTALSIFRSDVMADYMETTNRYNEDLLAAKSPEEREAIRATYAQAVRGYEREAADVGDNVLAGQMRAKRKTVLGEGGGALDNPTPEETLNPGQGTASAGDDTIYYTADGGFDSTNRAYDSSGEFQSAYAKFDKEAIAGLHDGTYVYSLEADGKMNPVQVAKFHPTLQRYGSYLKPLDGGGSAMVYVEKKPVVVRFKGVNGGMTEVIMPGWSSAQIDGVTVFYGPTSTSDGVVKPTLVPPWSGDEGTVEDEGYRTNMDRTGDAGEETVDYTDPYTGQKSKRTAYVVDINMSTEDFYQSIAGPKQEGETDEKYQQRLLKQQQAEAGGALAGEAPKATEMGTPVERGPAGGAAAAPPTTTTAPPPAREVTEADVDFYMSQKWGNPERILQAREAAETRGEDPDAWEEEQRRLFREQAQSEITAGRDPQTGAPLVDPYAGGGGVPTPTTDLGGRTYALSSPLVFSEALTSNDDLTGMTVAAMSSQKHWQTFISQNDPSDFYDAVIKANGIDPAANPERAQAIADEVNQIYTLGAWGNDELEFAIRKPKSSMADVARDAFTVAGVIFRNAQNRPVGQDARQEFIEQVTGGGTTLSPEEAKQRYPGLAEDIDTSQRRRTDQTGFNQELGAEPPGTPGSHDVLDQGVPGTTGAPPVTGVPPVVTPTPSPTGQPGPYWAIGGAPPAVPSFGLSSIRKNIERYGTDRFAPVGTPPPPVGNVAPTPPPGPFRPQMQTTPYWQQQGPTNLHPPALGPGGRLPAPVQSFDYSKNYGAGSTYRPPTTPYTGRAAPKYPARYGAGARAV